MTETGRRIRFTADFDWKPTPMVTQAFKAGQVEFVRKECAEKAIRLGKAEPVTFKAPPAGIAATIAKRPRKRKAKADGGK